MNSKLYRVAYELEQKRRNELDKKIIEAIIKENERKEERRTTFNSVRKTITVGYSI